MVKQMNKKIMGKKERLNQKGIALIWVYLLAAFITTMIYSFYSLTIWQTRTDVVDASAEIQAFYLAETAVDDMYKYINTQVAGGSAISTTVNRSGDLGSGKTFTASYDPSTSMLNATGTASVGTGSIIKKLYTKIVIGTPYDIPPGVEAGLTAGSAIEMSGLLVVDGRNHDISGEVTSDGIPGITYYDHSDGLTYDESVSIGGPANQPNEADKGEPVDPTSIATTDNNTNLLTPEAVFGLASGDLDAYKSSTPPASTVNGIYYYSAPVGDGGDVSINLGDKGAPGSGVLIIDNVANPTTTVSLSGTFNGILIVRNGSYNLAAETLVSGALVNVSSSESAVNIAGPDPDSKDATPAYIQYCVQCVEGSQLPEGLNNTTVAGIGSWANFRSTSNPLIYTASAPNFQPSGDAVLGEAGK